MSGQTLKYFAGSNTAEGFYNLFDEVLLGLDRVFILKGGPGNGKSTLMKHISKIAKQKGYDVNEIYCSSDVESLDGVIIPKLKFGIVDGTAPHVVEPKSPGVVEDYINLGVGWIREKLLKQKAELALLRTKVNQFYTYSYDALKEAKNVHFELEKLYINEMDFQKADIVTEQLIIEIFNSKKVNKTSTINKRFLGATTPSGPVHFIENLTAGLERRYFIKGRAGTGKSTMQRKLINVATESGYDVEIYYCSFDPHSIDMIIIRELSIAVFDSTKPHELFPSRDGDKIIDMYELTVKGGTDEKYAEEIKELYNRYKSKINEGIDYLAKAKETYNKIEEIYVSAMDFTKIDEIKQFIELELELHEREVLKKEPL